MDDTILVRRMELRPPRRLTTQFAPEQRSARWPWLCVIAILALAAVGKPFDPARNTRLSQEAAEVLRQLP